ncbi:hypothetical protein [Streptomyces oceani]|uniref:Integral membrane protein n=1 Tax=Streptomyces oceani TaxID=1075402 RepID=A0A1E7KHX3_9ACTN|nr:hypothetical protein [Streptomyces oceani]OEV03562.1 hypothetical protein AN216_10885 [Streptomyces oceani]
MTDRRREAAHSEPQPEDNPFAPPPRDRPDRPWQPRRRADSQDTSGGGAKADGDSDGGDSGRGQGGRGGNGQGEDGADERPGRWGGKWSPRQPSRGSGGFGTQNSSGQEPGQGDQGRGGLRWDPSDRRQRHARYALHAGIWGLFFALFSLSEIALLLGALSVYWGVSGLRDPSGTKSGRRRGAAASASAEDVAGTDRPATPAPSSGSMPPVVGSPSQQAKARMTAATSGLIAGALALAVVAGGFTLKLVYSDYYSCKQDSLTQAAGEHCEDLVPKEIRPLLDEG